MDDDQAFVQEILHEITSSDYVDYHSIEIKESDEGRDAEVTLELVAGDRYRITFTEIHD